MNAAAAILLASLSIWDYPARFPRHQHLRAQFVAAVGLGNSAAMERASREGVELLPDDPTWRYNHACSLARFQSRREEALDELEAAIDAGFRDADAIAADADLRPLAGDLRFAQLVEYAREMKDRPLMFGPMATVPATGAMGEPFALGEQNLGWDFDAGCFVAAMQFSSVTNAPNAGDLYFNRDGGHSMLRASDFPGLTPVGLDQEGRSRQADLNASNVLFPFPVFGNCSRALLGSKFWRSIPRALLTGDAGTLGRSVKLYLSNQTWVFPSNADTAPVGTNGDVFASIAPYWIVTAGRSYSDLPYLRAALAASGALRPEVKRSAVERGLLAPTIQTLIRKTLPGVAGEDGYLTPAAHPTAFPPGGANAAAVAAAARKLTADAIPPVVAVTVRDVRPPERRTPLPELTYATPLAWAFVLRAPERTRTFTISAKGAEEFAFVQTHGTEGSAKVERVDASTARVTVMGMALSPTNRVDVAVVGRNKGTGWGAPSYVSFSRLDPSAPYSDPVLVGPVAAGGK